MDIVEIADQIQRKIDEIDKIRAELKPRAERKAKATSEYDKKMAITIIKMKTGEEVELEGMVIKNPPISIMEKTARGICYKEKLELDLADGMYKSASSNIDAIQAQLNGYQSIYRHLSNL